MPNKGRRVVGSVAATVVLAVVLVLALVAPIPEWGRATRSVGDLFHAALFAVLAVFVFGILRDRVSFLGIRLVLLCWVLVAAFGLATEVVQPLFGRDASWHDVWTDACGGLAGVLWACSRTIASRGIRIGILSACSASFFAGVARPLSVLTDATLQRLEVPRLASFEQPIELSRWNWAECRVERVREHATDGHWAMRVDLEPGTYPGVSLAHPVPDWSGFRKLIIDAYLNDGPPLNLTVKIEDEEHNNDYYDRFNHIAHLSPARSRISIDLSDVLQAPRGRKMNLRRVSALSLFAASLSSPRTLYLDNIRLE